MSKTKKLIMGSTPKEDETGIQEKTDVTVVEIDKRKKYLMDKQLKKNNK